MAAKMFFYGDTCLVQLDRVEHLLVLELEGAGELDILV